MPRIALDLNSDDDRRKVKSLWRIGPGLVPGQPNEGLVAQLAEPRGGIFMRYATLAFEISG